MIGIIDYGMSNLYSVKNACDYLGLDSVVSKDVSILSKCDKLILPGVGAFQDCMHTLHSMGLYDFIYFAFEKFIYRSSRESDIINIYCHTYSKCFR